MYRSYEPLLPYIQRIKCSPNPIPVNNGLLNKSTVIFGMVCRSQNLSCPLTNIVSLMLYIGRGNGNLDYPRVKDNSKDLNHDLWSIGDHYKGGKRANAKGSNFYKKKDLSQEERKTHLSQSTL